MKIPKNIQSTQVNPVYIQYRGTNIAVNNGVSIRTVEFSQFIFGLFIEEQVFILIIFSESILIIVYKNIRASQGGPNIN